MSIRICRWVLLADVVICQIGVAHGLLRLNPVEVVMFAVIGAVQWLAFASSSWMAEDEAELRRIRKRWRADQTTVRVLD